VRTRIRQTLAVLGLVVLSLGFAAPAFAQEGEGEEPATTSEEPEISHAAEECIELLEEGGNEPDDCHEAPSPLAPEPNEILWGTAAFAVLFIFFVWKGIPAIKNMEAQREERIRNDLERAEQARVEAEGEKEQYLAQIADARNEAGRIIDEARQAAEQVRRDTVARAEAEAAEVRARAQEDARLAADRAMSELRGRVGELSIQLAEKIVERNLDRNTQMDLVNSFIDQVGTR
jgi:F-type H+-transporting ATPase subunit b